MAAQEKLENRIAHMTDEQIETACMVLDGRQLRTDDERLARCFMLDEYGRRHGEEAMDVLMDAMGL